ncbi:MAG: 50S ribosomal protein L29 [Endomicrobia bacterium]|nr:50S ribosomal protein L29 [Endomicrobiia bacterium]MCX7941398.1 50S ribosomal protein L29 [Endomicrobiia bacterium]MDW8055498.1 50S ribosomal protein L29 [Elusimicrobiota bacterium]
MKKKQFEEIKNLSKEELILKLEQFKKELFDAHLKHSTIRLKNPMMLRNLRRDIARIKTLLRQKFGVKV